MQKYEKTSLALSLALHLLIFLFLFGSIELASKRPPVMTAYVHKNIPSQASQPPQIVHAATIDQAKVDAQIKQIQDERQAKKQAQIRYERKLAKQAQMAKQARLAEQQRLVRIKSEQSKLEKTLQLQRQKAQDEMDAMNARHLALEKKLVQLKKVQQDLAKTNQKASQSQAEKELQAQIASEAQRINTAKARYVQSEIEHYKALILNAISQKWIMPGQVSKSLSTKLLIELAPDGSVLNVRVLDSSGNAVLDRSVIAAVWKASPLPVPNDLDLFNQFRQLHLTVKPEGFSR